jgi:hypothetical protein
MKFDDPKLRNNFLPKTGIDQAFMPNYHSFVRASLNDVE